MHSATHFPRARVFMRLGVTHSSLVNARLSDLSYSHGRINLIPYIYMSLTRIVHARARVCDRMRVFPSLRIVEYVTRIQPVGPLLSSSSTKQ